MMQEREWFRPASSKEGQIYSKMWWPENPKAIIQIAHGMSEYMDRYQQFVEELVAQGFVVCMEDHAGHGKSIVHKGYFAKEDGWLYVVQDMKVLMDQAVEAFPGLPVFLMGHSMGSFLSRVYIAKYGGLTGCILSGTMGENSAMKIARLLASLQVNLKGPTSPGDFLNKLGTGGYNKKIKNPINKNAWLSTVDDVCIKYEQDPLCGFAFTAAGFRDLADMVLAISSKEWAEKVPKDLPIFLISGGEDPVGDYGKGPRMVYDWLTKTGHKTDIKIYPGKRHELLNEDIRDQVRDDIIEWLDSQI